MLLPHAGQQYNTRVPAGQSALSAIRFIADLLSNGHGVMPWTLAPQLSATGAADQPWAPALRWHAVLVCLG